MKELEQILQLWAEAREPAVLATVVKTAGSTYRLPGARLFLLRDGRRAGSVSGGCLEDELVKKAWWLTEGGPLIRRYDTTAEGEIGETFGMGCNGIVHLLLERVAPGLRSGSGPNPDEDLPNILELIRDVRAQRTPAAIAHAIGGAGSARQRLIIQAGEEIRSNVEDTVLAGSMERETRAALAQGASLAVQGAGSAGEVELFIETLTPPTRLLVYGAGDDAIPLVNVARFLGWEVVVMDGRAHYARREKFPKAREVLVRPAGRSGAAIDRWTVAVLMSHSYSQDLANLKELSAEPLRYLGILGPRKRTVQLLADAGIDEKKPVPELHSPVGLDIGADGPEQVALAVAAEIQATLNERTGGMLRERSGAIHARERAQGDEESFRIPSIACA